LFDLLEPEDVVPAWKRWSPILLRPEGLYGTRPAEGGNKASKFKAIREALRTAKTVWLATDCDREGQLIGQEILEHYEYRGQVMRVLFTAQDSQTVRDAFGHAKPNAEYASLYAAIGKPVTGHAKKERVLLIGTDQRITSGPAAKRPHSKAEYMTAPERFADSQIPLAPRAPSIHGPLQMPRPATVASGYRGAAGTTITFDCNSRRINQKHA
jgi:hypothetical protein